jgi:hypothetical protein
MRLRAGSCGAPFSCRRARRGLARLALAAVALAAAALPARAESLDLARPEGTVRIAQLNASLVRRGAGVLAYDIVRRRAQVLSVAEILLRTRADIVVLAEFDRDPESAALDVFADLLAEGVAGLDGLAYPHRYQGRVNAGEPSGRDLDGDGSAVGARDAWGYGRFPGQYAMAILSRFPIREAEIRSYRLFRWAEMPGARRPVTPDGTPHHDAATWAALRLSSKSHWIVPVELPDGRLLHVLTVHPTPPIFDGPEDLNGRRNADEIRLLAEMIDGPGWLRDDAGRPGGLAPGAAFVVAGTLNADPVDGEAVRGGIAALLGHPRVADPRPESPGARAAADPRHDGPPGTDTADWPGGADGPGALRADYVLPSTDLEIAGSGVFWPAPDDPLAGLVEGRAEDRLTDHRLVWVDIRLD